MELYSENEQYKLYHWNMLDMLNYIEGGVIDSIVTDPPYELNFMWKWWDNSWIAFNPDTWKKCLEVLKPWWYLLAFWGSRTYHRIACAIEDAGFEIRDCIMWLYGSWFPKSMNIWLAIDKKNWVESIDTWIQSPNARPNCTKDNTIYESWTVGKEFTIKKASNEWNWWGTALKPSYEPIIVARKPLEWSCTDNVIKYWVGGINIDECRVWFVNDNENTLRPTWNSQYFGTYNNKNSVWWSTDGRFPANTILTYWDDDKEEVCSGFPYTKSTWGSWIASQINTFKNVRMWANWKNTWANLGWLWDEWSASRYFYCAKASKRDRDEGLPNGQHSIHPTVKPTDLMQYLVRLVTPNGWTVLDPFNWSWSTGKAVMYENKDRNKNYKYIWIELTDEYLPIAKARIEYAINAVEEEQQEQKQPTLFDI
jgi:site-specific DNA-methyltransferase (adenine-specific)